MSKVIPANVCNALYEAKNAANSFKGSTSGSALHTTSTIDGDAGPFSFVLLPLLFLAQIFNTGVTNVCSLSYDDGSNDNLFFYFSTCLIPASFFFFESSSSTLNIWITITREDPHRYVSKHTQFQTEPWRFSSTWHIHLSFYLVLQNDSLSM